METRPESPRMNLHDRSVQGFIINIQRNAYPRGNTMRYQFTTIEKLKLDAVRIFKLPGKVDKIFDESGKQITSEDQMKEKALYFMSIGEKFAHGMPSPKSRLRYHYSPRRDEEEDENQKPTSFENDVAETIAKKQEEEDREKEKLASRSPESKKEKEVASFNRLIALSNKSVREAYLESTLATFASTEPDQKAKLTKYEQLSNLSKNASYYDFINHLVTNQMAPSYGTSELQDEVEQWCIDTLMQLSDKDINFIISGFPATGKSSTLYSLSTILFRKIQQSAANGTFLFFPLNFQKYTLEFNSITQIYNVFVTNTLNAARYCNYAIAPFVSVLCQWFISIPESTAFPSFPTLPEHVHGVDFKAIKQIGQDIFDICKVKNNLQKLISAITDFPANFAETIGLKTVIFIFDHFEYCNIEIIDEDLFPDSLFPIKFAPDVCRSMSEQRYIVSCEDEKEFVQAFTCEGATPLDTEGICKDHVDGRSIIINPLKIKLSLEDCIGAPGVISAFDRVCTLASKVNSLPPQPKNSKVMSAVTRSKRYVLKREVMRLFKVLYTIGNKHVSVDSLNEIEDASLAVTVDGVKRDQPEVFQEVEEVVVQTSRQYSANRSGTSSPTRTITTTTTTTSPRGSTTTTPTRTTTTTPTRTTTTTTTTSTTSPRSTATSNASSTSILRTGASGTTTNVLNSPTSSTIRTTTTSSLNNNNNASNNQIGSTRVITTTSSPLNATQSSTSRVTTSSPLNSTQTSTTRTISTSSPLNSTASTSRVTNTTTTPLNSTQTSTTRVINTSSPLNSTASTSRVTNTTTTTPSNSTQTSTTRVINTTSSPLNSTQSTSRVTNTTTTTPSNSTQTSTTRTISTSSPLNSNTSTTRTISTSSPANSTQTSTTRTISTSSPLNSTTSTTSRVSPLNSNPSSSTTTTTRVITTTTPSTGGDSSSRTVTTSSSNNTQSPARVTTTTTTNGSQPGSSRTVTTTTTTTSSADPQIRRFTTTPLSDQLTKVTTTTTTTKEPDQDASKKVMKLIDLDMLF